MIGKRKSSYYKTEKYLKYKKSVYTSYKEYRKQSRALNKESYLHIANGYNNFMLDKILSGEEIELPARFGRMSITGSKPRVSFGEDGFPKGLMPDWGKTVPFWEKYPEAKKLGKFIYHLNPHTDGVVYKYFWSQKRVLIKYKKLYKFFPVRSAKTKLGKKIRSGAEYVIKPHYMENRI